MIRRTLNRLARRLDAFTRAEDEASLRHAREQADLEAARRLMREHAKQSARNMTPTDLED